MVRTMHVARLFCLATAAVALGCSNSGGNGGGGDASDGGASASQSSGETEATADGGDATDGSEGGDGGIGGECSTDSPGGLASCVDGARYQSDLETIAQPRDNGTPHWQTVQDLCASRFEEMGFTVERMNYASGVNVVGRKAGTETPAEEILLAAHYDHIQGCDGADDNASGVAAVLEAARVLSQREFPRTLVVACWDEEEDGLIGARAYAADAAANGDQLIFNYNYEMIGYVSDEPNSQTVPAGFDAIFPAQIQALADDEYRGNFITLIVNEAGRSHMETMVGYAEQIELKTQLLPVPDDVKNSPLLADLRRSDHAAFWEQDIPAAMITDTSEFRYANYHCRNGLEDVVENLNQEFSTKVIQASVAAAAESLGLEP